MQPDFPQSDRGPVADETVTPIRQQGLALLPCTFGDLENAFPSTQDVRDFLDWGQRTKRVKFDKPAAMYVADPRGPRT